MKTCGLSKLQVQHRCTGKTSTLKICGFSKIPVQHSAQFKTSATLCSVFAVQLNTVQYNVVQCELLGSFQNKKYRAVQCNTVQCEWLRCWRLGGHRCESEHLTLTAGVTAIFGLIFIF